MTQPEWKIAVAKCRAKFIAALNDTVVALADVTAKDPDLSAMDRANVVNRAVAMLCLENMLISVSTFAIGTPEEAQS